MRRRAELREATQLDLLARDPVPIDGFAYQPELIPAALERALVAAFADLEFKEFEFHGFLGRRRVISYGARYNFSDAKLQPAPEIPSFLDPLRDLAGSFAGVHSSELRHALVTEYQPGAAIGWHRDRPVFGDVVGISLLSPCQFRLRRKVKSKWERHRITLAPRSAYLLRGPARQQWQHSIPPARQLRYSVTFRTLKMS